MSSSQVKEAGELAGRVLTEVEQAVVGKSRCAPARARRDPGQGARAARGLPRAGQDAGGALVRAGARARLRAGAVHPRPAAGRPDRVVRLRPAARASSSSAAVRCSRACCSPTRSTGPRRRPRRRCSRRCRSARSPSRARRSSLPEPFHVLATANPIEYEGTYPLPEAQLDRFLLRVSLRLPHRRRGVRAWSATGWRAGARRSPSTRSPTRPGCWRCRPRSRPCDVDESVEPLLRGAGRRHPLAPAGAHRVVAARVARAGAGGAGLRGAPRPRLRHPRGRQGRRPRGARAPDHHPARALDDRGERPAASSTRCWRGADARRPSRRSVPAESSRAPSGTGGPRARWPAVVLGGRRQPRDGRRARRPGAAVLVAPLAGAPPMGLLGRAAPAADREHRLDHLSLHEGQGTTSRLDLRRRRRRAGHPGDGPGAARRLPPGRGIG